MLNVVMLRVMAPPSDPFLLESGLLTLRNSDNFFLDFLNLIFVKHSTFWAQCYKTFYGLNLLIFVIS